MKVFWIILAVLAIVLLYVVQFFHNIPKFFNNAFRCPKKRVYWNPLNEIKADWDATESFYHD